MPVKLDKFIIIDAPPWFGAIWAIIKVLFVVFCTFLCYVSHQNKKVVMTKSFQSKWVYVKRENLEEHWAQDKRFPDIADGTLKINLQAYCNERRAIERQEGSMSVFRDPTEKRRIPAPRVEIFRPSKQLSVNNMLVVEDIDKVFAGLDETDEEEFPEEHESVEAGKVFSPTDDALKSLDSKKNEKEKEEQEVERKKQESRKEEVRKEETKEQEEKKAEESKQDKESRRK